VYDGICPDPEVFGALFDLGGPPTWKMKKYTILEFEKQIGDISASARCGIALYLLSWTINSFNTLIHSYSILRITNNVTVRWNDSGEFKLSGSYGI